MMTLLRTMDPSLDAVIEAACSGEAEAFRQLVERCNPQLADYVAARSISWICCEECVQATWVTAHAKLGSYQQGRDFGAWLRGIARLHIKEWLRRNAKGRRSLDEVVLESIEEDDDDQPGRPEDLEDCLQALQPRVRTMLERRHVESVPVKRLAQQFKQTEAAIAGLLRRARSQVQRCLEHKASRS